MWLRAPRLLPSRATRQVGSCPRCWIPQQPKPQVPAQRHGSMDREHPGPGQRQLESWQPRFGWRPGCRAVRPVGLGRLRRRWRPRRWPERNGCRSARKGPSPWEVPLPAGVRPRPGEVPSHRPSRSSLLLRRRKGLPEPKKPAKGPAKAEPEKSRCRQRADQSRLYEARQKARHRACSGIRPPALCPGTGLGQNRP